MAKVTQINSLWDQHISKLIIQVPKPDQPGECPCNKESYTVGGGKEITQVNAQASFISFYSHVNLIEN